MNIKNKIFVGIVTCDRPEFFKQCYNSIKKCNNIDIVAVVNDGNDNVVVSESDTYIKHKNNKGVGISKNELFKEALKDTEVEHIFIVEDDIVVKDCRAFQAYIDARNITGIQHFIFGYHGPANKAGIPGGKPAPRFIVDYGNIKIHIIQHSVGAFCYYTREVLEKVGLIDEEFCNAFEHVEHDYRIAKAGFCTPYWNWSDISNSTDYLNEIECSEKSSSIRPRKDWQENIHKGAMLFKKKHNVLPAWHNAVPDTSQDEVKRIMKDIFIKNKSTIK